MRGIVFVLLVNSDIRLQGGSVRVQQDHSSVGSSERPQAMMNRFRKWLYKPEEVSILFGLPESQPSYHTWLLVSPLSLLSVIVLSDGADFCLSSRCCYNYMVQNPQTSLDNSARHPTGQHTFRVHQVVDVWWPGTRDPKPHFIVKVRYLKVAKGKATTPYRLSFYIAGPPSSFITHMKVCVSLSGSGSSSYGKVWQYESSHCGLSLPVLVLCHGIWMAWTAMHVPRHVSAARPGPLITAVSFAVIRSASCHPPSPPCLELV